MHWALECPPDDADAEDWMQGRYQFLANGQTVCVWTVQGGVLADGLDVIPYLRIHGVDGTTRTVGQWLGDDTADDDADVENDDYDDDEDDAPRFSVDWDAVAARLQPLRPPLGPPLDADDETHGLGVIVSGPHPAPDIDTYLDDVLGVGAFEYGLNEL